MATRQFNLRALALVIACASVLPIACSGDDDSNPTPPGTGGSGAKGGSGGKGGSGAKGGTGGNAGSAEGGATTGGTDSSGGTGGNSSGGKGGSSSAGKGGSSNGTGGNAGTPSEAGSAGGPEAGSGGTSGSGPVLHDCTDDDKVTYNCGTTAHPANIECYSMCNPTQTDGSEQFMNRCPNEPWTLGGVTATCQPWTTKLTKLGTDCTVSNDTDCKLPNLPN